MKLILVAVFALLPSIVCAQTNKCIDPKTGSKYFTDAPCPSMTVFEKSVSDTPVRDPNNQRRIAQEVGSYQRDRTLENAVSEGRVTKGMSQAQVERAIGQPARINNNGGRIQYAYPHQNGSTYIYLENGVVK